MTDFIIIQQGRDSTDSDKGCILLTSEWDMGLKKIFKQNVTKGEEVYMAGEENYCSFSSKPVL